MANDNSAFMAKALAMGLHSLRQRLWVPFVCDYDLGQLPQRFNSTVSVPKVHGRTAKTMSASHTFSAADDIQTDFTDVVLDQWKGDEFDISDEDMVKVQEDHWPRTFDESIKAVANQVETTFVEQAAKDIYMTVGTAGTTPFSSDYDLLVDARKKLVDEGNNPDGLWLANIDTTANANLLKQSSLQNVNTAGTDDIARRGTVPSLMGFAILENYFIAQHTAGTSSGHLVNGALTAGYNVKTAAVDTGTGTILVGDVVTFAGHTQEYVVTSALASGSFSFEPGLAANVVDNAAVTVKATHRANFACTRGAFAFAQRPIADTSSVGTISQVTDPVSGISLRAELYRLNNQTRFKYDILYGVKCVDPRRAVRILG